LPEIAARLAAIRALPFEKLEFSATDVPAFQQTLERSGARAVVVIGMETHVCVWQTVRALAARGLEVHVPADGVASRRDDHREAGLRLCERAGAFVTTTETVVFDMLRQAGGDDFKALSKLIR
jgi:nicotinamidase-related amidase